MRKLAIGLALASTALTAPANARDGQWYVGLEGGATIVEDQDLEVVDESTNINVNSDLGYEVGGIVGYDFGVFRLETELAYREADAADINSIDATIPAQSVSSPGTLSSGFFDTNGDINALNFMVNGLFDFGDDDSLQGYFGGGVGIARVETNLGVESSFLDDSDTGFAWQFLAGIRQPISSSFDLGLKYRYLTVRNLDFVDTLGRDIETDYSSHSLLASITYNFGGEAPAPVVAPPPPPPPPAIAPVAPPPPPPPPPAVVCNTGPYIVFFDHDKSDLRADGASTLDNAYSQYANCGNARVMLAGHADKSGSNAYNVALSERRNTVVRSYLESKGIGSGAIATEAFGETAPLVNTADGVREPQNRRVEVTYGPGSGN